MKIDDVIWKPKQDGWMLPNTRGNHHQFTHAERPGRVTIKHPAKNVPTGTLRNIDRQAQWTWADR